MGGAGRDGMRRAPGGGAVGKVTLRGSVSKQKSGRRGGWLGGCGAGSCGTD